MNCNLPTTLCNISGTKNRACQTANDLSWRGKIYLTRSRQPVTNFPGMSLAGRVENVVYSQLAHFDIALHFKLD